MKSRSSLFMLLVVVVMLVLTACGGAAATEVPALNRDEFAAATEAPAAEYDSFAQPGVPAEKSIGQDESSEAMAPMQTAAAFEIANSSGDLTVIERSNRMIVKNADIRLMVKDTDV